MWNFAKDNPGYFMIICVVALVSVTEIVQTILKSCI